ncbi:uncharacterized protein ACOB8E_006125 [Sarcophilus harrisii]
MSGSPSLIYEHHLEQSQPSPLASLSVLCGCHSLDLTGLQGYQTDAPVTEIPFKRSSRSSSCSGTRSKTARIGQGPEDTVSSPVSLPPEGHGGYDFLPEDCFSCISEILVSWSPCPAPP